MQRQSWDFYIRYPFKSKIRTNIISINRTETSRVNNIDVWSVIIIKRHLDYRPKEIAQCMWAGIYVATPIKDSLIKRVTKTHSKQYIRAT